MPVEFPGLPVKGYAGQSVEAVATVNENKELEERLLRRIEAMVTRNYTETAGTYDPRWVAVAQTHFEQGFMALNRAVFKPGRVELPEDKPAV